MIRRNKKANKRVVVIGAVVLITILLGITAYSIKVDRDLTFVEKGIKDTVLFVGKIFGAPINYIKDKIEVLNEKEDVHLKYKELLAKHGNIEQYETRITELEKELAELKLLNEINYTLSEFDTINATIINRNMNYWFDDITIDKGSTSGIETNMPVVIQGRLIGYVSNVSNFTSTIKLLTTSEINASISIKIDNGNGNYSYGLLTGYDSSENVYKVEGISDNTEIPMNAIVTTTGLGDRFPSGIYIGRVKSVTTDSFDLARVANVEPDIDMNSISFVNILKRRASY